MININWMKRGISLLFLAFFIALPISFFLPFFGSLFFFPFSDAVLLGLAATIAGVIPVASQTTRLVVLTFLWIAFSLALEVPNLPKHLSDYFSGTERGVQLNKPSQRKVSPAVISIVGVANPILSAQGSKWEVEPELNVGGMRNLWGNP